MEDWNLHKEKIIECLKVSPIVEKGGDSVIFRVEKHKLILELTINPTTSDVSIELRQEGLSSPHFRARIKGSTGIFYLKHPTGIASLTIAYGWERIEITAPRKDRYSLEDGWIIPTGIRIKVEPYIMVEMV